MASELGQNYGPTNMSGLIEDWVGVGTVLQEAKAVDAVQARAKELADKYQKLEEEAKQGGAAVGDLLERGKGGCSWR